MSVPARIGLTLIAALAFGVFLCSQQGQTWARQDKPAKTPTPLYYGVSACAFCHEDPKNNRGDILLCRCNETKIFDEHDKHKVAFVVLKQDRARRMGELLGIADVAKEKSCLSCHGVDVQEAALKHESFNIEDGVSCVVCHGAFAEWIDFHGGINRKKWRQLSRVQKEREYGMTDLWDPVKRTRLCVSCHVGNSAEGKVVTHAMYAAGHPPLPGVEAATFSNAMPRHWEYLAEKKPEVQKLLSHDPKRLEQTELVIVSGVVAFQESMRLLAEQAAGKAWPDYAAFDCAACHHDLRYPSWRQKRGYSGPPGRPSMRPWPLALVRAAVRHLNQDEKALDQGLAKLSAAFDARPFGDPAAVKAAAAELSAWADALLKELVAATIDETAARRLLSTLAALPNDMLIDYDSARQLAWACAIIAYETRLAQNASFAEVMAKLEKEVRLQLPSGKEREILKELPVALKAQNEYDPERFRQLLKQLAAQLPQR